MLYEWSCLTLVALYKKEIKTVWTWIIIVIHNNVLFFVAFVFVFYCGVIITIWCICSNWQRFSRGLPTVLMFYIELFFFAIYFSWFIDFHFPCSILDWKSWISFLGVKPLIYDEHLDLLSFFHFYCDGDTCRDKFVFLKAILGVKCLSCTR